MNIPVLAGVPLTAYRIRLCPNATALAQYSARELRYFLFRQYGITLPLAEGSCSPARCEIVFDSAVPLAKNRYRIWMQDSRLQIAADGMPGYEASLRYLRDSFLPALLACRLTLPFSHDGRGEEVCPNPALLTPTGDIRLMYYNFNAQSWQNIRNFRQNMQIALMDAYAPDVIGLQEFHPISHENGFGSQIEQLGFALVPVEITPEQNPNGNNYTPLYYRKEKLQLVDCGYRTYTGLNDVYSKGLTWAGFRMKSNGKVFSVITTHYWWVADPEGDAARVGNAVQMLDTVACLQNHPVLGCGPIFAGGDYNCTYSSPALSVLCRQGGLKNAFEAAAFRNDCSGHHGYAAYDEDQDVFVKWETPTGHYAKDFSIDHILYTGNADIRLFYTVTDRYALISSDHCPLLCDAVIHS